MESLLGIIGTFGNWFLVLRINYGEFEWIGVWLERRHEWGIYSFQRATDVFSHCLSIIIENSTETVPAKRAEHVARRSGTIESRERCRESLTYGTEDSESFKEVNFLVTLLIPFLEQSFTRSRSCSVVKPNVAEEIVHPPFGADTFQTPTNIYQNRNRKGAERRTNITPSHLFSPRRDHRLVDRRGDFTCQTSFCF